MIDLKLNAKRFKLHWQYYAWRYVIILAAALVAANFLYTATEPKTPYGQKVDIYLYSGVLSDDETKAWERELLRMLPPDQKEVNILSMPIIEGQDFNSIVAARMAAGEGTVIILPKSVPGSGGNAIDLFTGTAVSGGFIPLKDIRSELDLPEGIDLSAGTVDIQPDLNTPAESLWCGIPLDSLQGLRGLFDPQGLVAALPIYAKDNMPNALAAMNWLLSKTQAPSADAQNADRFTVTVASNYFATLDTTAWEAEQKGKFSPDMGFDLMQYHTGREDMVAQDIIAARVGKPGLCVVPGDVFVALARAGALAPLDDVQHLLKLPAGTDLAKGRETANTTGDTPAQERLYGIPVDQCRGLTQVFNPTGMMIVFPNQDSEMLSAAIDAANWLMGKTGNPPLSQ
jgi:hypothetical protein